VTSIMSRLGYMMMHAEWGNVITYKVFAVSLSVTLDDYPPFFFIVCTTLLLYIVILLDDVLHHARQASKNPIHRRSQ
jgi:hypothetical protein